MASAHDVATGKRQFLACVAGMVATLLLLAVGVWWRGAEFNPLVQLGRPTVFAGVALLAYRGSGGARVALAVWSALLAVAFALTAIRAGFESTGWMLVTVAFAAAAMLAAITLWGSDAIGAFLAAQRTESRSRPAA